MSSATTSAISTFKKESRKPPPQTTHPIPQVSQPSIVDRTQCIPCPHCGEMFPKYSEGVRGWNSRPHEMCIKCFRARRRSRRSRKDGSVGGVCADESLREEIISQVSALSIPAENIEVPYLARHDQKKNKPPKPSSNSSIAHKVSLDHHIFSSGEWRQAKFMSHPTMEVQMSLSHSDYKQFSLKRPRVQPFQVEVKLDSCAQSCLWSLKDSEKKTSYRYHWPYLLPISRLLR